MQLLKNRVVAVGSAAALLVTLGGVGGAVAANTIGSKDIKNNSVRSVDVKNGTLGLRDLNGYTKARINAAPTFAYNERTGDLTVTSPNGKTQTFHIKGADGQNGQDGAPGAPGTPGTPGTPGEAAGPNTNWTANEGSTVVDRETVTLTGGNTSVEIQNLNIPVQAGDVVSFDVSFGEGAFCVAGAPRVFIETQGQFTNSFDQALPCADGTAPAADNNQDGTITFTVPNNGRIGQAGVVFDNSNTGTVTVTDLTVDGQQVFFQ